MSKEVQYETTLHWSARPWGFLGGLFLALFGAAVSLLVWLAQSQGYFAKWVMKLPPEVWERARLAHVAGAAVGGVGLFILLVTWVRLRSVRVRIRGGQVEETRGIFSVSAREIRLETVKRIDVRQTFLQRLLGVGDVVLRTSSATGMLLVLESVKRPERLRSLIEMRLTRIG